MRGVSLCSGIGGLDRAAEEAGITVVGQVEHDEKCVRVLEKHWPHTPRVRDVREFWGDEFGDFDILFGGIPCQPYSVAGKRRAEADPRDLWPDALRIVRLQRPSWVLIENVANFARIALDRVCADLEGEGYTCGAAVLPACAFGAPHRRERCFVVAHTNGTRQPQPQGGVGNIGGRVGYRCQTIPTLAHSNMQRRQERYTAARLRGMGCAPRRVETRRLLRLSESRLGRAVDGVARRLDGGSWPVGRGEEQATWEAPRVVGERPEHYTDRLRQLGNAVVWQQAYPVFALIVATELLRQRNH